MSPAEKVLETRCEIGVVALICGNSTTYILSERLIYMHVSNKSHERPRLEIAQHETVNVTAPLALINPHAVKTRVNTPT